LKKKFFWWIHHRAEDDPWHTQLGWFHDQGFVSEMILTIKENKVFGGFISEAGDGAGTGSRIS
jgi:hypothetical protein